ADAPGRDAAQNVRLVAMAKQQVAIAKLLRQFTQRRTDSRKVASQADGGEAAFADFIQEGLTAAAFREADERRSGGVRQRFGQPEHLPFRTAEERARREMNEIHSRARPCVTGDMASG